MAVVAGGARDKEEEKVGKVAVGGGGEIRLNVSKWMA